MGNKLPTAAPVWIGILCGVSASVWLMVSTGLETHSSGWILFWAFVLFALPGVFIEFWRHHFTGRRTRWQRPTLAMFKRSLQRVLGLAQILACGWLALWIFPEYDKETYRIFRSAYPAIYSAIVLLSIPYFLLSEMASKGRRYQDIHRYIGRYTIFTLFYRISSKPILRQGALAYLVKMFFLPNMLGLAMYGVHHLINNNISTIWESPEQIFHYWWSFINLIDVLIAIVGYSLSLRILNTHVVHVDPTWRGWVATCICYFPFSAVLYGSYLTYGDGIEWYTVLADHSGWLYGYGIMLLLLHLLYMVASLQFGIRFSNLCHKGILTDGLFRFTKHPAYLLKNVVWWLASVPFIYEGEWYVGAANCLILLAVNGVYWWRARTEEMHLSRDPRYVEYALMMNDKSVLAFLGKRVPALAYKPPSEKRQWEYRAFSQ